MSERKTVAVRFEPDLHGQIKLLAEMRGNTLQDEVIAALQAHLVAHQALMADRAAEMRTQLDAEYEERKRALDALLTRAETP